MILIVFVIQDNFMVLLSDTGECLQMQNMNMNAIFVISETKLSKRNKCCYPQRKFYHDRAFE